MINKNGQKMVSSRNYLGNVSRTKVANDYNFRTTFKSGYLFPIYASDVLPSEFKSINVGELVRSITPLGPTMDNSFLDIFFFFVPKRLVWDHWEEFIAGYNKEAWAQDVEYTVPKIKFQRIDGDEFDDEGGSDNPDRLAALGLYIGSFLDYLPGACDVCQISEFLNAYVTVQGVDTFRYQLDDINALCAIDALYPRSYVKIWNDWFRDENLQDELELYTGDNDEYADEFSFDLLNPTALPKAAKYHNRFTSALPAPQKGPDVLIPMDNLQLSYIPDADITFPYGTDGSVLNKITFDADRKLTGGKSYPVIHATVSSGSSSAGDISIKNVSNTIRMLRLATQTELLLARDARGGTRYVESLLSHFGVHNGDARLQRSEYLGSRHIPLQVLQVTNTAASNDAPLGSVGGQSMTKDNAHYFTKSFTEHGIILGLATVRTNISYSSGIRKQYQRFTRFDHIWPEFKHIGDVPLYTKELAIHSSLLSEPDKVFGYTPYGSELREGYNYNNGLFRSEAPGSLAYLTYQEDYYSELGRYLPVLSASYIEQPDTVLARTLVDQNGPQFYALFSIHEERVIPLDPTSDPGLMDHF